MVRGIATPPQIGKDPPSQADDTSSDTSSDTSCTRSLRWLFADWPAVALADARLPAEPPDIPAEEARQIATAVPRRRVEFAAARQCVRLAAKRLGVSPFILRNGADRAPLWPAGVVGSLTHTGGAPGGYCAAAVARADEMKTIGLDAENAQALPLHLWRFVLTSDEQVWLCGMDPERQGLLAKVIFSAKECFYKAQFPLTHCRLGFHDVEIGLDPPHGTFAVRLLDAAAPAHAVLDGSLGRFILDEELVKTALALESRGASGASGTETASGSTGSRTASAGR